jgi:hypothetical protein
MKEKRIKELDTLLAESLANWEPTANDPDQRRHQSTARTAFLYGIRRGCLWSRTLTTEDLEKMYDLAVAAGEGWAAGTDHTGRRPGQ